MHDILLYLYLLTLLLTAIIGLLRFKVLDVAAKILSILIVISLIDELCSFYAAKKYHNDIPIYNVFSVIEFVLVALYFNYNNDIFRKYRIGICIAIVGCIIGIADIQYQTINHLDSYFLFFDGITTITMALYSIARLVQKYDDLELKCYPHFWISTILTFFWAFTFLTFGLYDYLQDAKTGKWITTHIQLPANIITYAGICIVFIFFPKMSKNNEG